MSDGMDEIIDDFVTEAEESLEKIDPLFVQMETRGFDKELLNDIFRSMHTIKGAAGFLGFQQIVDVAHKTENLLKRLRDGDMDVSSGLITLTLRSVDVLKMLLGRIKKKQEGEADIDSMLAELDEAMAASIEAAHEEKSKARPAPAPREEKQPIIDTTGVEAPRPIEPSEADLPPDILAALKAAQAEFAQPAAAKKQEPKGEPAAGPAEPAKQDESPVAHKQTAPGAKGAQQGVAQHADDAAAGAAPGARSTLQTLRVDVERIDKVMNLTGEIVLVRNRLLNIANYLEQKYSGDSHVDGLQEAVSFLDLVTSDIQLAVMKMRMQPIKKVFGKFPRLVRDISQNLGKDVHLNISGEDTEVDRSVIERIGDPLVHIIRNAIDHGIEGVDQRRAMGKPAKGHVDITAYQQGSMIVIEVTDDGKGMDVGKIKDKALRLGIVTDEEASKMTDKEAINLIFLPGFSTVEIATELSGRGVGMDVVKTNISKLNGYVEILTTKGVGSTVRISIPLTLAIIQALMVRTGGVQYAIPLGPIEETIKISMSDVDHVTGSPVLAIRDRVYPLAELTELLNHASKGEAPSHRYVLVIAVGDRHFCVAVDQLLGQEEVVIKAIDGIDTDATGILGATITGEGKIVLILDPSNMSRMISGLAKV